jgi:hypothetical protein
MIEKVKKRAFPRSPIWDDSTRKPEAIVRVFKRDTGRWAREGHCF